MQPPEDGKRPGTVTLRQHLAQGLASRLARSPWLLVAAFAAIGLVFSLAVLDRVFPL
ncbi:MAG: hypothetical protein ACK6DM_06380 [Alphaproteobacteria bacterium]